MLLDSQPLGPVSSSLNCEPKVYLTPLDCCDSEMKLWITLKFQSTTRRPHWSEKQHLIHFVALSHTMVFGIFWVFIILINVLKVCFRVSLEVQVARSHRADHTVAWETHLVGVGTQNPERKVRWRDYSVTVPQGGCSLTFSLSLSQASTCAFWQKVGGKKIKYT